MSVFDLEFHGLAEFPELVVEFDDFAVLVELVLDFLVEGNHKGTEESYGVVIGFQ